MWVHEFDADLWRQVVWNLFGSDDLGESARRRWSAAQQPRYWRNEYLVAMDDGVPMGVAHLELPVADNTHIGYLSIVVDPLRRGKGVGAALFDAAVERTRAEGRTTIQMWTYEPLEPTGTRRLRGTDGDGAIDPDSASARFLLHRGFTLMQVDTMSGLDLPPQAERDAAAEAARATLPPGYELVQWTGTTPGRWLTGVAALQRAMSTDVPTGGAELEEEHVDEERVHAGDEVRARAGLDQLVTAVHHVPTGSLVGFTRVFYDPDKPVTTDQWETIVLRGHRGHALGWAMKVASHAAVGHHWPAVRRIVTGNASENSHMLSINRRLGYTPIAASGWFERKDPRGAE